jgi:hypothetical protein
MTKARSVAALIVLLLTTGCATSSPAGGSGNPSSSTAPTDLASAEAAWQQAAIRDYTLDVTIRGCMACGVPLQYSVTVVDGDVTDHSAPKGSNDDPMTVEDLFKTIRWYQHMGADVDQMVTYNDVGVPVEMNMNAPNVSDVQADYSVTFAQT